MAKEIPFERSYYINKAGTTRTVFIAERVVIKTPTTKSWRLFLNGLLANLTERTFCKMKGTPGIPRLYFSDPIGLVVVMERLRPVRHRGLFWVDLTELIVKSDLHPSFWRRDSKPENYGFDKNMQLTKLDLG